jgi:hypothetical protein
MHRAKTSLLESADGSMATVATRQDRNFVERNQNSLMNLEFPLTPTGLLMEGDFTQNHPDRHFERNREWLLKKSCFA